MHSFEVHSNESACRKKFRLCLEQVYYETCASFSSTKYKIYDKEKSEKVKVIILYKYKMDSNKFVFDPTRPKIDHS